MSNRNLVESEDDSPGLDHMWGWAVGGGIEWGTWSERISLLSEVWLLEKGFARQTFGEPLKIKDRNVSVPVLLGVLPWSCNACPQVILGPCFERIVDEDDYGSDDVSKWGVALNVGARVRWARYADVRLRYIDDVSFSAGSGLTGIERVENRALVLSVGASFGTDPTGAVKFSSQRRE